MNYIAFGTGIRADTPINQQLTIAAPPPSSPPMSGVLATSRAYVQSWLADGQLTQTDVLPVFGAANKILKAGRAVTAGSDAPGDRAVDMAVAT